MTHPCVMPEATSPPTETPSSSPLGEPDITRALSVKLSSVLRTAECHSRRTFVSCGSMHPSMCHCSRPISALLDHSSSSPQAQMTLPLSLPAQSSSRASVSRLPCIIFVMSGEARSDLARPITRCALCVSSATCALSLQRQEHSLNCLSKRLIRCFIQAKRLLQ